jgi:hypothetical protein
VVVVAVVVVEEEEVAVEAAVAIHMSPTLLLHTHPSAPSFITKIQY